MIELLEKGYFFINFYDILNQIIGLNNRNIPEKKPSEFFEKLFFNPKENTFTEQCFSKTKNYKFLKSPFRSVSRNKKGKEVKNIYYAESDAQNCLVSVLSLDDSKLYSFFHNTESYFKKFEESVRKLLLCYDEEYIETNFLDFPRSFEKKNL